MKPKLTFRVVTCSSIFWTIMGLSSIVYTAMGIIILPFNVRVRHAAISSWSKFFIVLAKYICGLTYEVEGEKNIIEGPAIISSNHQSMWETMVCSVLFPAQVPILKRELLYVPFFGWALKTISPIAIDRSKRSGVLMQIYKQGKIKVSFGFWLLFFPEGTRAAPGKILPFKNGIIKVAQKLELPIIPIAHNAGHCMPKGSFWVYPGHIKIVVGEAINVSQDSDVEKMTTELEQWTSEIVHRLG